jgi:hypothetical protein
MLGHMLRVGVDESGISCAPPLDYLLPPLRCCSLLHPLHRELLLLAERTVSLLAFDEPQASPVGDLMDVAQRQKTASELNAAILSSQGQEREPRLLLLLKMMLWAQQQLDEKAVYPKVTDLATARLSQVGS